MHANPLLADWTTPFGLPPFAAIGEADFRPAFEEALAAAREEVAAVAAAAEDPSFANTVEALERSGRALERVSAVFFNLAGAHTSDEIDAIRAEVAPRLARFSADTLTDPRLFARVDALMDRRDALGLTPEQDRVLELTHRRFVRAGARLDESGRERMGAIMERLAALGARFSRNVLADERAFVLPLGEGDLAGLPDFVVDAAREAAKERGLDGWAVTLSRSLIEPFLQFSERRDLREKAWRAWIGRGEGGGETDTRALVAETLKLRKERAALLGFDDFASFKLEPEMAKTPAAVRGLLEAVWAPARARAAEEAERLRALASESGANHALEPWDWRFWAERLRARDFDLREETLKPYLPLDAMIEAAFDVARRLFGLDFAPVPDAPVYHPDVRVWEVTRQGRHLGVFMGDYFNRASKRSGAWCSGFRRQETLDGEVRPIVVNVMNFAKGSGPTLLTFDDARTLFHEFGHALHALLSDVTYPSISGTAVSRDFVELPSQLYEHWLSVPEVLAKHARHVRSGEPMPADLIETVRRAETFNQGFATVEYVASALVDLALHTGEPPADPAAREAEVLAEIGMPREIAMRHRTPHFQHVFAGDGYSAGYYSYMWSEVMDADAFSAFEETGDPFDPETARRLEAHILSAGGRQDPEAAWLAFRGARPTVDALLRRRGLAA